MMTLFRGNIVMPQPEGVVVPLRSDDQFLHDSRRRAQEVLAKSAQDAQGLLDDAHRDAVQLLIEQQLKAAELLVAERVEAEDDRRTAVEAADSLSEANGREAMAAHDRGAADLLERERIAAQMLLDAQRRAATILEAAVQTASVDLLMAGQKEAAAILLEARMRVEDQRAARHNSRSDD